MDALNYFIYVNIHYLDLGHNLISSRVIGGDNVQSEKQTFLIPQNAAYVALCYTLNIKEGDDKCEFCIIEFNKQN